LNRRQFQAASEQARKRAVELGEAGDTTVVPELIGLCGHAGPTVRRAAASALGKLATDTTVRAAVPALCTLARDPHPQVRQYALLALGKISDEAALPTLRDAANCANGPDYVLAAALKAIEQIEAAAQARCASAPAACSRCGRETSADERRISESQFQRAYCAACFDAVFIERRNFDMKVQNQKTILSADRTVVQSRGERQIADWLAARRIPYRYDDKFQIIQGFAVRPDFYLPHYDVYIEFWGLDTTDYKIGMLLKQKLCQQEGKRLISLYPADLPHLNHKLGDALRSLVSAGRDEPRESSPIERGVP